MGHFTQRAGGVGRGVEGFWDSVKGTVTLTLSVPVSVIDTVNDRCIVLHIEV